jgi:hypothetical protein
MICALFWALLLFGGVRWCSEMDIGRSRTEVRGYRMIDVMAWSLALRYCPRTEVRGYMMIGDGMILAAPVLKYGVTRC